MFISFLSVSPLSVSITSMKNVLSAGRKVEIICETRGSRPPAIITWFKNNRQLTHSQYIFEIFIQIFNRVETDCYVNYFANRESVSSDGNVTTSVLNLMPTVNDNDAYLICRAENIRLPNQFIENGWKLHVYCESINISKL